MLRRQVSLNQGTANYVNNVYFIYQSHVCLCLVLSRFFQLRIMNVKEYTFTNNFLHSMYIAN